MVESQFEQDSQISTDSPLVLVKAAEKTSAIQQLLDYISNYQMISLIGKDIRIQKIFLGGN